MRKRYTQLRTYLVEWGCPSCKDGVMIWDGVMANGGSKRVHDCDKCGYQETAFGDEYPVMIQSRSRVLCGAMKEER